MSRLSARSLSVALVFALAPVGAQAAVVFGDIGYDVPGADAGREWVAIQNTGPDAVNLTGWKFFEGGVNHKLTPFTSALIPAGAGAVIVSSSDGYLADHPGYAGLMFKSSFSLSNTGETLSLKNASSTVMATITYAPKPAVPKAPLAKTVSAPQKVGNHASTSTVHTVSAPLSQTASAATAEPKASGAMLPWVAGVAAVIALGIGAAFMMRQKKGSEADAYAVTEEQS